MSDPDAPEPARPEQPPSDALDFERAELSTEAAALSCAACKQPIVSAYYGVNSRFVCAMCHERLIAAAGKQGSFLRALAYGSGAALVGAIGYYGFTAITGWQVGIVAIFVGVLVGKAVRKGAGFRAGKRYRALAVVLTYMAMTAGYIPEVLKAGSHHSLLGAAILSFILPVLMLSSFDNILGLIILAIGVYEGWKLSAAPKLDVQGPFSLQLPPSAAEPALP